MCLSLSFKKGQVCEVMKEGRKDEGGWKGYLQKGNDNFKGV